MDYSRMKSNQENIKKELEHQKTLTNEISKQLSTLVVTVSNNEKRDEEERKKNEGMFAELYNSKNKTNEVLIELTSTVKNLVTNMEKQFNTQSAQFDKLEKKIDDLANEHRLIKKGEK